MVSSRTPRAPDGRVPRGVDRGALLVTASAAMLPSAAPSGDGLAGGFAHESHSMNDHGDHSRRNEPVRVIDRRTFTPEGEPRKPDHPAEEAVATLGVVPPAAAAPAATPAAPTHAEPAGRTGPAADPVVSAHFQNLVVNLARQAAANLGASRHPLSGQIEIDLEGAQQMIDLLQALRAKTTGNLTADEQELVEGLIGDLQMQYVAVRSKAGGRP
jgi:hypothetical protein